MPTLCHTPMANSICFSFRLTAPQTKTKTIDFVMMTFAMSRDVGDAMVVTFATFYDVTDATLATTATSSDAHFKERGVGVRSRR
jgi:hypothetical protein